MDEYDGRATPSSTRIRPGVRVDTSSSLPEVTVIFTKPGSVGLELQDDLSPGPNAVSIVSLVPDTQAMMHPDLRPGLKVTAVAGVDVRGLTLDDVVDAIIAHPQRPLEMSFADGSGTAANAVDQSVEASAAKPSEISVVFTQQGSVGLDLREDPGPSVSIERVKPGTQATQHSSLKAGLTVTSIAGQDVRGKSLDEVFDVIIDHQERPLEFRFEGGGSGAAANAAADMADLASLDPMASTRRSQADDDAAAAAKKKVLSLSLSLSRSLSLCLSRSRARATDWVRVSVSMCLCVRARAYEGRS